MHFLVLLLLFLVYVGLLSSIKEQLVTLLFDILIKLKSFLHVISRRWSLFLTSHDNLVIILFIISNSNRINICCLLLSNLYFLACFAHLCLQHSDPVFEQLAILLDLLFDGLSLFIGQLLCLDIDNSLIGIYAEASIETYLWICNSPVGMLCWGEGGSNGWVTHSSLRIVLVTGSIGSSLVDTGLWYFGSSFVVEARTLQKIILIFTSGVYASAFRMAFVSIMELRIHVCLSVRSNCSSVST